MSGHFIVFEDVPDQVNKVVSLWVELLDDGVCIVSEVIRKTLHSTGNSHFTEVRSFSQLCFLG